MPGYPTCWWHGSGGTVNRGRAAERIAALVPTAVETLWDLATNGESEAVRLQATVAILQRTGFPAGSNVEDTPASMKLRADDARRMLIERIDELWHEQRAARGLPSLVGLSKDEQRKILDSECRCPHHAPHDQAVRA